MAFTWADYLLVARTLYKAGDEASLRAAVSRAYYAVFGEAKAAAEIEMGQPFPIGDVHKQVANYYDGSPDSSRKVFAANLSQLKSSRVRADYYMRPVDVKLAAQAIHDANKLLQDLAAL